MALSDNLRKAKEAKNDEFYTRLEDIEAEILQHQDYIRQFEGKTVYCNCDDPEWSNFFVFFKLHFKQLKLKKLITTHYNKDNTPSYKLEWTGEMLNDDMANLIKTPLQGNGDFRSEECEKILRDEADFVVSNPPFSAFRSYLAQLKQYNKKFVIIGNKNAIAYKEVFPLLKEGEMCVGYNAGHGTMHFSTTLINNERLGPATNSVPSYWFTNLDLDKFHEPLTLTKNYYGNESRYPKYDNYDAIECSKVKDIPKDYFPCWYDCPHAAMCQYALTEAREDKALCEMAGNGEIGVPIRKDLTEEKKNIVAATAEAEWKDRNTTHGTQQLLRGAIQDHRARQIPAGQSDTQQTIPDQKQRSLCKSRHTEIAESVMESSESLSHSLQNSAKTSSELLEQQWDGPHRSSQRNGNDTSDTIIRSDPLRAQEVTQSAEENSNTIESSSKDYHKCNGEIGVPITYLAQHCEDQMEIIGDDTQLAEPMNFSNGTRGNGRFYLEKELTDDVKKNEYRRLYSRIIIRRKKAM